MHHKLFFMFVVLLILVGTGTMVLFKFDMLPAPIYAVLNHSFTFSHGAPLAYLEKFEGAWNASFEPAAINTDVAQCTSETGTVTIHNGEATGIMNGTNKNITLTGNVDTWGHLTGTTTRGSDVVGSIDAMLRDGQGQGQWSDSFDCSGTITLTKRDPVVDPIIGKVVSFHGTVELHRGDVVIDAIPGIQLYAQDVVAVPDGGSAYLSIGPVGQPVNLTGPTTYTVTSQN